MKKMKLAFVPLCVLLLVAASCKSAQVEETIKEIRKEAIMSTQAPVNTVEQMMQPAPQINEIPKVTMVPQEE